MWKVSGAILILASVTAIAGPGRTNGDDNVALRIMFLACGVVGFTFLILGMWKDDKKT